MNLGTMRTKLRRRIGNPDTGAVSDALLNEHLNDAHREIATNYHQHKSRKICTFPTIASTSSYGLTAAIGAILLVKDVTNNKKLVKLGPRRWANLSETDPASFPLYYTRLRNFIQLSPTPAGIYTIRLYYRENVTDLAIDADEPLLPIPWHPGIVYLARHLYYDDNGDVVKSKYAFDKYTSWLSTKPTEMEEEMDDLDTGVELPTLSGNLDPRLDFDHSS